MVGMHWECSLAKIQKVAPEPAPELAPEVPPTPEVPSVTLLPEAPIALEVPPVSDPLYDIIAATIGEGFKTMQGVLDQIHTEQREIADAMTVQIEAGKNGVVLKILEAELADLDGRVLVTTHALATLDQRIIDAVKYVHRLADPLSVVIPEHAAGSPRTTNGGGGGRPRAGKYSFNAKVDGIEVDAPTNLENISNLTWFKCGRDGGKGTPAAVLRMAFGTQTGITDLESYLRDTTHAPITAHVLCIDGKTRSVELRPAAIVTA